MGCVGGARNARSDHNTLISLDNMDVAVGCTDRCNVSLPGSDRAPRGVPTTPTGPFPGLSPPSALMGTKGSGRGSGPPQHGGVAHPRGLPWGGPWGRRWPVPPPAGLGHLDASGRGHVPDVRGLRPVRAVDDREPRPTAFPLNSYRKRRGTRLAGQSTRCLVPAFDGLGRE